MPELPEVETIVKYLHPKLRGKRISKLNILEPRIIRGHQGRHEFIKEIVGKRINYVSRHGKYVILGLSGGNLVLIHLMMTGQLLWNPQREPKYARLIFFMPPNNRLVFNDIRKFGRCRILSPQEKISGDDALSISSGRFTNLIHEHKGRIKSLFLNQDIISGIGNIYSDEILWHAGIHPLRHADNLKSEEIKKLYRAMKYILRLAINKEGTSMRNYLKPDGSPGGYYKIRKVYQRTGEKCQCDSGIIQHIVISGRRTHFCPKHQV